MNVQHGLHEGPDEHCQFVKIMTTQGLNQVSIVSRNDFYTMDCVTLKPQCRVPTQENEDKIPNKGAITKKITLRFLVEEMPKHPGSTFTASPPMITDAAPSTSHSDFEHEVIDALEMLQEQFRMWKNKNLGSSLILAELKK
ncbi:hypothetical protein PVK06_002631 [Gossypium arboreum]|uniref:Uncharacterized protein n=1 Tax=Gossypium arboreum TaxID=29729 RepID=A0ABR0R576_GOSAR|nr:hypothetical protein PVK06_002631 [Gossypium arboreum]